MYFTAKLGLLSNMCWNLIPRT